MLFNSIQWRLQVWYGLLLVVFLAGFGVAAYELLRGRVFQQLDGELQRRLNEVDAALRNQRRPDPLRQRRDLPDRLQDRPSRPFPEGQPGGDFPDRPGPFAGPPP